MNLQNKFIRNAEKKEMEQMAKELFDESKLNQMYIRVVKNANKTSSKNSFIKCSVCGEEILMIPTLKVMKEAIEKHVQIHKNQNRQIEIFDYKTPILIRLDLMIQVLNQFYKKEN